jgi:hypothetical protein
MNQLWRQVGINKGAVMTTARFSNHSAVIVPYNDRENLRKFYCDVLGSTITKPCHARNRSRRRQAPLTCRLLQRTSGERRAATKARQSAFHLSTLTDRLAF